MVVTGAPSVERDLGLSHEGYVLVTFAGPLLLAAVLEGAVALHSDRWDRRWLAAAGQGTLALSLGLAAVTRHAWGLTVALALAGAASGVACGAAQATLILSDPRGTDRAMVRWTLFASVGDVITPLVTAAAIALGFSYRGAALAIAVVVSLQCAASLSAPMRRPAADAPRDAEGHELPDSSPAEPIREALARALRQPALWAWLFAAATCTLLDELVVALTVLRLDHDLGLREAYATGAAVVFALGSVVGSSLADGAVARWGSTRVLRWTSVLCAIGLLAVLGTREVWPMCVALFAVGVLSASHHPLTFARAYDAMPGNPGTVQAITQLFGAIDVAAPLALGVVADRHGLRAAIACLLLQPITILACAAWPRRAPR